MGVPSPFLMPALVFIVALYGLSGCFSKKVACLHKPGEKIEISCPKGQVIMNPKVKVGKNGQIRPNISNKCKPNYEDDCFGITPEVVAQTNNCHFLQICSVVLNSMMPITKTENRSCLAKTPDYAILETHDCVCEKTLKFVCSSQDNSDTLVRTKEGVLVSHQNYPWYYPKHKQTCRVFFSAINKYQLTLWSDDIDLDPDGTDNLSLYKSTLPGNRKLIGEPIKYSENGINETFTGSTIEVVFDISEATKAGRGFVIKYKWTKIADIGKKPRSEKSCKQKSKDLSKKRVNKRRRGRNNRGNKRGSRKNKKSRRNGKRLRKPKIRRRKKTRPTRKADTN